MGEVLAASRRGSGEKVLFLHGIGSSRTAWDRVIDALESDFLCIAPDMPGYGASPDPQGEGLGYFVETLIAFLDGESAHVVGVSFGALLAIALAARRPDLVRSLALIDATLGRGYLDEPARNAWLEQRKALAASIATNAEARARQIAATGADEQTIAEIARHMRRARPEGYNAVAAAIAQTDAAGWLPGLTMPALVLYGAEDKVTGRAFSRKIALEMNAASLIELPAAGHAPQIECPDLLASHVRAFLHSLGATPCPRRLGAPER